MSLLPFYDVYSRSYLICFFAFALLETLLCSGITYGWAIIVVVFNQKRFYMDLCNEWISKDNTTITPVNDGDLLHGCPEQQKKLSLILTVSLFCLCGVLFPAGMSVDRFGPRVVRTLGGVLYVLSSAGLGFVVKGYENVMFLIFPMICMCGSLLFVAVLQVVNIIYREQRSRILCVLHGALDSSAVMMLIFKISFDAGFSLKKIMLVYSLVCGAVIMVGSSFLIPPRRILLKWIQEEQELNKHLLSEERSSLYGSFSSLNSFTLKSKQKVYKPIKEEDEESDADSKDEYEPIDDSCDLEYTSKKKKKKMSVSTKSSSYNQNEESVYQNILSLMYILELFYFMTIQLKLWFFVGSLTDFLYRISDNDQKTVDHYLDLFGYIQFGGLIVNAISGVVFNRQLSTEEEATLCMEEIRLRRLKECVYAFSVTNFIALLLCAATMMEDLRYQIPSYIFYVVVRGFLYGNHGAFVGCAFPASQFGRLYGLGYFIGGAFGVLQYPLYALTSGIFHGDPFWANTMLLVLVALGNIFPIYLWWYIRKETKKIKKGRYQAVRLEKD